MEIEKKRTEMEKKRTETISGDENQILFSSCVTVSNYQNLTFFFDSVPYLKLTRLGRGGSSTVYKVLHPQGEIFAVKHIDLSKVDNEMKSIFIKEIDILDRLSKHKSKSIIKLIKWQLHEKPPVLDILLEYGEITLTAILEEEGSLIKEGKQNYLRLYWQQMLEAVRLLHEDERIIHGDLKPENFVLAKGKLKLIDFGIAKIMNNDTTSILSKGLMGTLHYMAPEMIVNYDEDKRETKYGHAVDVWSLGVILYYMVFQKKTL